MSQNQLISLLVGTKAAEAQGLTGEALSRAKLISLVVGNPVVSLLAVRAMGNCQAPDDGSHSICESSADGVALSKEAALSASEASKAAIDARAAATQADLSAQAAAKSAEEAKSIAAGKQTT